MLICSRYGIEGRQNNGDVKGTKNRLRHHRKRRRGKGGGGGVQE